MKNFFLNGNFRPAPFNLLFDGLLLWFVISPIFMFDSLARNFGVGTNLFMMSVFGFWFCWRRAWIQKAIQSYYQSAMEDDLILRQRLAEQKQQRTLTDTQNTSTLLLQESVAADSSMNFNAVYDEILRQYIAEGKTTQAIKRYRDLTHDMTLTGWKEAKAAIERPRLVEQKQQRTLADTQNPSTPLLQGNASADSPINFKAAHDEVLRQYMAEGKTTQAMTRYRVITHDMTWIGWEAAKKAIEYDLQYAEALDEQKKELGREPDAALGIQEAEEADYASQERDVDDAASLSEQLEALYGVYAVSVPLTSIKWSDSQAVGFLRALLNQTMDVELAIVGKKDRVYWEITCYSPSESKKPLSQKAMEDIAQAYYPGAQVKRVKRDLSQPLRRRYLIFEGRYQNYFEEGLSASSIRTQDPLLDVARVCSHLQPGEQVRYMFSVMGFSQPDQKQLEAALMVSAREVYRPQFSRISTRGSDEFLTSVAGNLFGWVNQEIQLRGTKLLRFSEAETERYMKKLSQPLVYGFVSVEVDSPSANRLSVLQTLVGAVEQMTAACPLHLAGGDHAKRAYRSPELEIADEGDDVSKTPLDYVASLTPTKKGQVDGRDPFILALTLDELAGLWHLPTQLFTELKDRIEQPSLIPPELVNPDPAKAVIIGTADTDAIGIQMRDLNLHAFVAGMQGQGKSTLLHNIAHQLIEAGHGVAILDPHRALINNVLATAVDDQALERTVLLEAEDSEYPIPLNPMRATPGMSQEALFSSLMWVIKALYAKSWSEGQMERMFRNILQIILTDPEATPLDIQKLLEDPNYRRRAIAARKAQGRLSHAIQDFWERFDEETASSQRDRSSPVLNRLGVFLDGAMELMMSHPFGLDFRTIIHQKKVLLFDLAGGSMLSEADNLGSIFFAMLFFHSFALGEIKEGEPPRYHVIIDETHRFVKAPIQQMFSEARKYGLSLILADQWLGQLDESTRDGIINNKGTTISFRVAPDQAKDTARLFEPEVTAEQLVKQGRGEAAVATIHHARTLPAFTLKTLPPLPGQFNVQQRRAQAKTNLPSIMFSPDPNLRPKRMSVVEIDDWLHRRYTTGVFARDLQAETQYEDSVPVVPKVEPPVAAKSVEDEYTDSEEI